MPGFINLTNTFVPPIDTTPDAFTFTDVTGVALNTLCTSNTITVAGVNSPTPISITGGEYKINAGPWVSSAGTVGNGDQVTVRGTSSGTLGGVVNVVLTIGGVTDTYSITSTTSTADFTMPTLTNVPLNVTNMATVTVAGFGASKTASLSGAGAQFRKNGGAFGTANLTVSDGDVIDVIWPASNGYNVATTCVLTIDGLARTGSATTSVNAAANILAFLFNPLSHAAESALGGDWASHQTKWQANLRRWDPDYRGGSSNPPDWGAGASAWDTPSVYWLMSYLRGSGLSADTADFISYMNDYNTDMPDTYHSQDAWALGLAHFIDYIYNSRNFNTAGCRLTFAEWQYEGSGCTSANNFGQYWSQRWLCKDTLALLGANWAGVPNGSYGFRTSIVANFVGGPPALLRAFIDAAISMAETNNGWVGQGMYQWPLRYSGGGNNVPWGKPWQDAAILQALILAYRWFYPYDTTLKDRIIGGAEWLWAACVQYSGTGSPLTVSNVSGKWAAVYVNRYTVTDADTVDWVTPDLCGFYTGIFGQVYALTGDTTWRTRLRRMLKGQVTDAWYTSGHGNTTGNKIMGELVYTPYASFFDNQTYPAPSYPVCSADPVGSITSGNFNITGDGTWSGSPTATQYEIWRLNPVAGSNGLLKWNASGASMSVAGLTGQWVKGRVRKQNAAGWGCWADTNWVQVP